MIARYAWRETSVITTLGAAATIVASVSFGPWGLVPAAVACTLLAFYRDPPRRVPALPDTILAPADGRVLHIERNVPSPELGGPALRIVIFLSLFNVHVNRGPCAARVARVTRRSGRHVNALRRDAARRNESVLILLEPEPPLPGPVAVRQISGLLAREIVCRLEPGRHVTAGQRFGMIKLGSQTEVLLPESTPWQVLVSSGSHVKAGTTALARFAPARRATEPPSRRAGD